MRDQLQSALGSSYTLERELGRGGMATVFLARDTKHGRSVALKVLHADLAASLGPERFRREIGFAATLQHPHILTVLDSGETNAGQLWFTMPFVEGETLRDRLRRQRQLPITDALRIGREIALALDYAHRHGVVHRDVKPENVLLTSDGQALVADFGIARGLTPGASERTLTETGLAIGTPQYMSPEQASGERTLDGTTNVYSLGAVVYEMLAGEPPFTGPTAQAVVAKMMSSDVPSVRKSRPAVSEGLEASIKKALAPVPADRYQTAGEFAKALESAERATAVSSATLRAATPPRRRRFPISVTTLGLGVLLGGGVLFAWRRHAGGALDSGAAGAATLAVLPFENLGDSTDAYFADGITDEVRGKLASVAGIQVIASGSSNQYRHTTKSLPVIAQELGARYLLVGRVRWEHANGKSRVRVDPELVQVAEAKEPTTKWQQPFDAELSDVFQVQADIAGKVASALNVALGAQQQQVLAARPTENLAAYDAFLKGEAAAEGVGATDPPSLHRAIDYYDRAVALDPAFALAWAQLARAHAFLYNNSSRTPAESRASHQAADRAKALAPDRPETQVALGTYERIVARDNASALTAFDAGLAKAPANADLLSGAAAAEQGLGHSDEALARAERSQALDPRSARVVRQLAGVFQYLRRYPEARAAYERALTLAPTNLLGIERLAMLDLQEGNLSAARGVIRTAIPAVDSGALLAYFAQYWDLYWVLEDAQQQFLLTLPPSYFDDDRAQWGVVRAETYWVRGDLARAKTYADTAQRVLREQLRETPQDDQRHMFLGLALAMLGRKSEAIEEGERGAALRPVSRDAVNGLYDQQLLARIYMLSGDLDRALDHLEPCLKLPYYLSPGWLKIDPTWAPLHGNPRFERLVSSS